MLPLWRRVLRVALCPDKVIIVALDRGYKRKILSQTIIPLDPENSNDWRQATQALERWLDENDFGKAEMAVCLSSCFARFAMMPFDEGLNSQAERKVVAGLLLEGIYGEAAKQWRLALDAPSFRESSVIAAIDSNLAEAIEQIAESRKCRIASIQPYAATAINAFGKQVSNGNALFVLIEHAHALIFEIKEKRISAVRKILLGSKAADHDEIAGILHRERLISGLVGESDQIFLHVNGMPNFKLPAVAGLKLTELQFGDQAKCFGAGFEMLGLDAVK